MYFLFFGEVLPAERVHFVSADAFTEGFSDRQVEACEVSHRLSLPAKQHGQSLTAIMSNCHTTDREYIADCDLAIFQELVDGRQGLV